MLFYQTPCHRHCTSHMHLRSSSSSVLSGPPPTPVNDKSLESLLLYSPSTILCTVSHQVLLFSWHMRPIVTDRTEYSYSGFRQQEERNSINISSWQLDIARARESPFNSVIPSGLHILKASFIKKQWLLISEVILATECSEEEKKLIKEEINLWW